MTPVPSRPVLTRRNLASADHQSIMRARAQRSLAGVGDGHRYA